MAERDDVGDTVANNQVVDSSLLLPPDDDDGPDVHHQGDHRAGDVGVEVEDFLRLVYLYRFCIAGRIQYKVRTSQINLNKVKIAQIELIPFSPQLSIQLVVWKTTPFLKALASLRSILESPLSSQFGLLQLLHDDCFRLTQ